MKNTWWARLKPLEVELEIRDDLYLTSSAGTSENWRHQYWKYSKQCWLQVCR